MLYYARLTHQQLFSFIFCPWWEFMTAELLLTEEELPWAWRYYWEIASKRIRWFWVGDFKESANTSEWMLYIQQEGRRKPFRLFRQQLEFWESIQRSLGKPTSGVGFTIKQLKGSATKYLQCVHKRWKSGMVINGKINSYYFNMTSYGNEVDTLNVLSLKNVWRHEMWGVGKWCLNLFSLGVCQLFKLLDVIKFNFVT